MGFISSSDTLGFLIIGTGILSKIWLGNGIETTPSGPSNLKVNYTFTWLVKAKCSAKC